MPLIDDIESIGRIVAASTAAPLREQLDRIEAKINGTRPTTDIRGLVALFRHIRDGEKIEAIKRVCTITGIGIREAKEFVELWRVENSEE
jgi:ribosomal protein L7/L12